MTLEIILNGEYNLDINDDINVLFTYQVGDVRNFLQNNSSFSKTISIAGTASNNLAFKNLFDITNVSDYNPNKKASVVITDAGIEIFTGYLKVDSIKIDFEKKISYECTVYSQIADMVTNLGQQNLNVLTFPEYEHTYNMHNVIGSWNNFIVKDGIESPFQLGEGYVYPYIDWAAGFNSGTTRSVEFFKPCLYAKTVWDKIFSISSGYTYQSDFINSNYFKSLIVTPDANGFAIDAMSASHATVVVSQTGTNNLEFDKYTGLTDTIFAQTGSFNVTTGKIPIKLNNTSTSGNTDIGGNFNTSTYEYTVPVSGQYEIDASVTLDAIVSDASQSIGASTDINVVPNLNYTAILTYTRYGVETVIDIITNSITPSVFVSVNGQTVSLATNTPLINLELIPNPVLMAGDVVKFYVQFTCNINTMFYRSNTQPVTTPTINLLEATPTYFSIKLQNDNIWENTPVTFTNFLGTDLCSDFIMSIAKMFNLYFEFNPENPNCLIMEPRENFYNGDVIDWTYKLDRDNETENFTMAEITASNFLFTYKSDSDYYNQYYEDKTLNEVYGQYIYYLDNDFISKQTQDKVDLIFAPTPLINEAYSDRVISTVYNYQGGTYLPSTSSKPRILFYAGLLPCEQWTMFDGYSGGTSTGATLNMFDITTFNSYPYAGYLDNPYLPTESLCFGEPDFYFYNRDNLTNSNLINKFWLTSLQDISDKTSSLLTGFFKLNTADIQNLSFRDIIYLDSQYWILNKITDYNPLEENLTKVELLRLVNYGQTSGNISVNQQSVNLNHGIIKSLPVSGNTGANSGAAIGKVIGNTINHNLITGQVNTTTTTSTNNIIAGNGNQLTSGLVSAIIAGDNNQITGNSSKVVVIGDNNTATGLLHHSLVLGSNLTGLTTNSVNSHNLNLINSIEDSGTIKLNGNNLIEFSESGMTFNTPIFNGINFITAGTDEVADEFPQVTTINFITAGRNRVLGFGTNTIVNFITAGRDSVI